MFVAFFLILCTSKSFATDFSNVTVNKPMFTIEDDCDEFFYYDEDDVTDLTNPKYGFVVKDNDNETVLTPYEDYYVQYIPHSFANGNCHHSPIYSEPEDDGEGLTTYYYYGNSMYDAVVIGAQGSKYAGMKIYTDFICVNTYCGDDDELTIPYYGWEYELEDADINYKDVIDPSKAQLIEYAPSLDSKSWSTTIPTAKDPGEYHTFARCKIDGDIVAYGYERLTITSFNLEDAYMEDTIYTYDGTPKTPKLYTGNYHLKECKQLDENYLKIEYLSNVIAGTATVRVSPISTSDEHYIGSRVFTFNILRKGINTVSIEAIPDATYTGSAIKPELTVKDGTTKLVENKDYVIDCSNNTNIGTATVTIHGIGNYEGTKTTTFKIVKGKELALSVSSIPAVTYSGNQFKPVVIVKDALDSSKVLVLDKDYTVSYGENTLVGNGTVTIIGKGDYNSVVSKVFKINPKGTSINKLSKVSKAFTVKWKAQKIQTTGYQIRYSTKSGMSGAKLVTVKSNKTTSKKISKLKAKKKYYVQIRTYKTVDGTKYYSSWSTKKSIKTK